MTLHNLLNPGQPLSTLSEHLWDVKTHKQPRTTKSFTEKAKTLDIKTQPEGVKTPCVQLVKFPVSILENTKDLPVGGRLKWFAKQWKIQGAHPFQVNLLKVGYRLPFKEHPKLSRTPCIVSGYSEVDKNNALSTSILYSPKMR